MGRAPSKIRWTPRKEGGKSNDDEREKGGMDGTFPLVHSHITNAEEDLENLPKNENKYAALQFMQEEIPPSPAKASKMGKKELLSDQTQAQVQSDNLHLPVKCTKTQIISSNSSVIPPPLLFHPL